MEKGLFGEIEGKPENPTRLYMRVYKEVRGKNADQPSGIESGFLKQLLEKINGDRGEFEARLRFALGENAPWPFNKDGFDISVLSRHWQRLADREEKPSAGVLHEGIKAKW